jgi:RNA polymerase sigma-70 factor (ECF subfamily)
VGGREAAEDVLQAALVKGFERGSSIRGEESVVAWFYRVLRNAVTDHYRHRAVEIRSLKAMAREAVRLHGRGGQ